MKRLWLMAAMAVSVAGMQVPAFAGPVIHGIPPHGIHGIIRPCWHHRCCRYRYRCGPHGIIIGRPVIGRPVNGLRPVHPIGVTTHGIGPVGPTRGGLVNGIPAEQRVQH
jgi:hypothetical protein